MATVKPHSPLDLALAPVAVAIDVNLQRLRGKSGRDIGTELVLELDRQHDESNAADREATVLRQALRDVDMHGWHAELTDDRASVRLTGGSVSLDVGLGADVMRYLLDGPLHA
jgi:hypothetical protein